LFMGTPRAVPDTTAEARRPSSSTMEAASSWEASGRTRHSATGWACELQRAWGGGYGECGEEEASAIRSSPLRWRPRRSLGGGGCGDRAASAATEEEQTEDGWAWEDEERRENMSNGDREDTIFILQMHLGVLLKLLQCTFVSHFGDAAAVADFTRFSLTTPRVLGRWTYGWMGLAGCWVYLSLYL
jgi:hypothetical protein